MNNFQVNEAALDLRELQSYGTTATQVITTVSFLVEEKGISWCMVNLPKPWMEVYTNNTKISDNG